MSCHIGLTKKISLFTLTKYLARASGGGLNWYRNINRLPAITAPFLGSTINQPSFYMGGSTDLIAGNTPEAISSMQQALGDLRHCEIIEGAGHWLQQERPLEINQALLNFINSLN